jgi:hypothetical protein
MKKILGRFKDPAEPIVLLALFLVSLCFFIGAIPLAGEDKQFPMASSLITMVCITIYFVKRLTTVPENPEDKKKENEPETSAANKKIIITTICFAAYVLVTYLFGFLISSALIAAIFPLLFKYKNPLGNIICFIWNVAVVLIFQSAMGIPLCRGVLLDLSFLFF